MAATPHILVFDSGAGGLSIAKAILQETAYELRLSYLADTAAFPYGSKQAAFVINRVETLIGNFIERYSPDLVVIACNTASTVVLTHLRQRYTCPVVGVVPAIKPAANQSITGCIGVLATSATVERDYTAELIRDFAPHCEVFLRPSDDLVEQAERALAGESVDHGLIKQALSELLDQSGEKQIDTLVLGCTHYPLILNDIIQSLPEGVDCIDSGEAISRRVSNLLSELNTLAGHSESSSSNEKNIVLYTTRNTQDNLFFKEESRHQWLKYLQESSDKG